MILWCNVSKTDKGGVASNKHSQGHHNLRNNLIVKTLMFMFPIFQNVPKRKKCMVWNMLDIERVISKYFRTFLWKAQLLLHVHFNVNLQLYLLFNTFRSLSFSKVWSKLDKKTVLSKYEVSSLLCKID